jgi:hypothetical protein
MNKRQASGQYSNWSSSRRTGSRRERWREGQEGKATIPNRMRAPETMVLEGIDGELPRAIEGQGGQQRRPTSRDIVSSLPPLTKGPRAKARGCTPRATVGEGTWMGGWEATRR